MQESPNPGPDVDVADPRYARAFAVADELNVHHSTCVCPRCAGRLPGLLVELAQAVRETEHPPGA